MYNLVIFLLRSSFSLGHKLWSHEAVLLLIELYKDRKEFFDSTRSTIRKDTLFAEVSATMAIFNHPLSAKQCRAHWEAMVMKLKEEYDASRRTGSGKSTWEWFDMMMPLFEGTATLEPPYLVSAGSSSNYSVRGVVVKESPARSTRTRPTPPSQAGKVASGKDMKPRQPVFKNQALALQEQAMAQKSQATEDLIAEVRLMRTSTEQYREQSLTMFGQFLECLRKQ